jgi:hypothetical protein
MFPAVIFTTLYRKRRKTRRWKVALFSLESFGKIC